MAKKLGKLTAAVAGLAGAGAAVVLAKKMTEAKKAPEDRKQPGESEYRNTELGRHEKNSKGIYYTNGNYEAFARPEKPEGVEEKNAYIVGSGLAALAAACFLVREMCIRDRGIMVGTQTALCSARSGICSTGTPM